MKPTLFAATLVAAAFLFAACGGDEEAGPVADQATPAAEAVPADGSQASNGQAGGESGGAKAAVGTTITTGDSQFGDVLFDGDQGAIYYFAKEETFKSECYGDCAVAWPPVLTDGDPRAGGDARSRLVGTTERRDGSTQVTYDGRPLYYYVDDPPGVVLCHNVAEFGALWLAVQPDGEPVP